MRARSLWTYYFKQMFNKTIHEKAYAKLNISLDVTGRLPDGYHSVKMVMITVGLHDEVTVSCREGRGITVKTDLHYLPNDDRNIAYRCADVFLKELGCADASIDIDIKKQIPVCAGMGGGSADGAAVLRALNVMAGSPFGADKLRELGGTVGSDIPFCIQGGTALAEGKGEILTDLPPFPDCTFVVVKPSFCISTPKLFSVLDGRKVSEHPDTAGIIEALGSSDLAGISRRVFNVFESALTSRGREVYTIKDALIDRGADAAAMTGTGSAVFGIFSDGSKADEAFRELGRSYKECFITGPVKKLIV